MKKLKAFTYRNTEYVLLSVYIGVILIAIAYGSCR
jgi:hypothetical protein